MSNDKCYNNLLGLAELEKELNQDFQSMPIRSLCVSKGPSHLDVQCFKTAAPLEQIKSKYFLMAQYYKNDIFHRVWEHTLQQAFYGDIPELTIPDIVTKIWNPTFDECCRILDSLSNCSIKLQDVDKHFRHYCESSRLKSHLEQLHKGIEECHDREPPTLCPQWIDSAVERIQQYWILSRNSRAAQTLLDLKHKLNLDGDFSLMETVATKVWNAHAMQFKLKLLFLHAHM